MTLGLSHHAADGIPSLANDVGVVCVGNVHFHSHPTEKKKTTIKQLSSRRPGNEN